MERSYYSKLIEEFLQDENILGKLTKNPQFSSDGEQRNAWIEQIDFLKKVFKNLKSGHILFDMLFHEWENEFNLFWSCICNFEFTIMVLYLSLNSISWCRKIETNMEQV